MALWDEALKLAGKYAPMASVASTVISVASLVADGAVWLFDLGWKKANEARTQCELEKSKLEEKLKNETKRD